MLIKFKILICCMYILYVYNFDIRYNRMCVMKFNLEIDI